MGIVQSWHHADIITGQGCLQNTPDFEEQGGGEGAPRLANGNLYLIPACTVSFMAM